jgi:hypothetical protein
MEIDSWRQYFFPPLRHTVEVPVLKVALVDIPARLGGGVGSKWRNRNSRLDTRRNLPHTTGEVVTLHTESTANLCLYLSKFSSQFYYSLLPMTCVLSAILIVVRVISPLCTYTIGLMLSSGESNKGEQMVSLPF